MGIKLNIMVDIAAFAAFVISAFSGFVLMRGISLELARHSWLKIHDISSIIFVILVVIHLVLHRRWIKNIPKMIKGG